MVDPTIAALLGGAVGLLIGAVAVAASRWSEHTELDAPEESADAIPRGVGDVLSILPSIAIVLDGDDTVVNTSASAVSYGLVRHGELVHTQLRDLAHQVRRDGVIREAELDLARGPHSNSITVMGARVAPLGIRHVLVLAEDHTHARRVEEVRRDFVANVSHELKTPVGGISLLAEAILDGADDPVAVVRFAERIQVESTRLTKLVQEIVDLSRLQVADTLHAPELVDIGAVVAGAIDRTRLAAEARGIAITVDCAPDLRIFGDAELIEAAVANLVTNAVNYSDADTRVLVTGHLAGDLVKISVADRGRGIPVAEQTRIFERFYRVDPARSRATGGTGLGLAIVKHICANHGGSVRVVSEEGHGSTFTMSLPAAAVRRPDGGPPVGMPSLDIPLRTPRLSDPGEVNA